MGELHEQTSARLNATFFTPKLLPQEEQPCLP